MYIPASDGDSQVLRQSSHSLSFGRHIFKPLSYYFSDLD